jgi:hypothetical protein
VEKKNNIPKKSQYWLEQCASKGNIKAETAKISGQWPVA